MKLSRKVKKGADANTAQMLLGKYMQMVELLAHYEMRIDALEARCALLEHTQEHRSEGVTGE